MNFFQRLAGWLTTSSSVLGLATAAATTVGASTGAFSWAQALVPMVGAALAVALPQSKTVTAVVPVAGTVLTDGEAALVALSRKDFAGAIGQVLSAAQTTAAALQPVPVPVASK